MSNAALRWIDAIDASTVTLFRLTEAVFGWLVTAGGQEGTRIEDEEY